MRLLISDANILIDLADAGIEAALFDLPYELAVPDVLFEEELREQHGHLETLGLRPLALEALQVEKVVRLSAIHRRTSRNDLFALVLAKSQECPLLTGDAALRQAARDHGVEVHGTLWIVEQLVRAGILSAVRARTAFDAMREAGSRLPWPLVDELLASLEDSSSSDHPT